MSDEPEIAAETRPPDWPRLFRSRLRNLETARPSVKHVHQPAVFEAALRLLGEEGGIQVLSEEAPRFDRAGVFLGGDWDDPGSLVARFVGRTLRSDDTTAAVEILSQLRLLAVAEGRVSHPGIDADRAAGYLEEVLALNVDILFPSGSEAERAGWSERMEGVHRLLRFFHERLGPEGLGKPLVEAAERLCVQRAIRTEALRSLLDGAAESGILADTGEFAERGRAMVYALRGPTRTAREAGGPEAYGEILEGLDADTRNEEARAFARSMRSTGLVSPHHAALVRFAHGFAPDLLPVALGLDAIGRSCADTFRDLVSTIVHTVVRPETASAIYGLSSMLNRGTLLFPPVAPALWRVVNLPILPEPAMALATSAGSDLPPHVILAAGVLQVLGQPLGVKQGQNPTCQSARAISLWAQYDPGALLEMVTSAVRDGSLTMHFEGTALRSGSLAPGMADELHPELDPVSVVLVPHLDRIYAEMGRRTAGRGEDGHRWINPEFHGWWVDRGFAIAVDVNAGALADLTAFLRLFFTAYHPYYNGNLPMKYAQPAGIAATDRQAGFVGWHAVAIQRVALDAEGEMRVYFYNPNNDSRQHWGQDIQTSIAGRGEFPGEASLPFGQFASRLYVFHYDERELGDPERVPAGEIEEIRDRILESWGRHFGA